MSDISFVVAAAREATAAFETRHRRPAPDVESAADVAYIALRDDAAAWVHNMVQDAHLSGRELMFPDDHRYGLIASAVDTIADSDPDGCDFSDRGSEWADAMVDVYTHDRLKWLASDAMRPGYCDDAAADGMVEADAGIVDRVAAGQFREASEVWDAVLFALRERAEVLEVNA